MELKSLKCIQPFFDDVWSGRKNFEIRFNDRDYQVGDKISMIEFNPGENSLGMRKITFEVAYLLTYKQFPQGLQPGYVIMGLANIHRLDANSNPPVEDLDCPQCGKPHVDAGEWALRAHKTHLCLFCNELFEGSYKAVSRPLKDVIME